MNTEIIFNPEIQHISEIEKWLEEECNLNNNDIYCNINEVYNSFKDNRLIIINEDEYAIGFLEYSIQGYVATIARAVIKPNRRRKGLGKKFIENCCSYFKNSGAYVVDLYCSPIESENAWKKFGFLNLPDGVTRETRIFMYKILVPTLPLIEEQDSIEIIQLWNDESIIDSDAKPTWTWKIERFKSSKKLVKPIIHPANYEWIIRWSKGGETIEKTKIKKFNQKGVDSGKFLIITEL